MAQQVKNLPADVGDTGEVSLIPGLEKSLEKEMATQYSCLEDPMKIGAWQTIVHGISKSQI